MRTAITLDNSNCTRCHNRLLDAVRAQKGVRAVRSDFTTGCLVVEHDGDLDALVSLIASADRAVTVAGNGEREMVPVGAHQVLECRVAKDPLRPPPDEQGSATAATNAEGTGSMASRPRTSSDGRSPAAAVCPVCHADPASGTRRGGRGGVRTLRRERPAPGLALRTVRVLVAAFRKVFGLPPAAR